MRAALALGLLLVLAGCEKDAAERIRRAHEAMYKKDAEKALRELRLALDALDKDDSAEGRVLRARALRATADLYYLDLHDSARAVEVYRELILSCPEAPEAIEGRIFLADLLRDHYHDLRGAIPLLAQAIDRNAPQSAELSYKIAKLYFELRDYQQAVVESQKLIDRFQTSPLVDDASFLQAQALAMMDGKQKEAIRAFQTVIDRFPDSELQPYALFELGKLEVESAPERAISLWVQALKRHPDPKLVQDAIARARRRIVNTTPATVGDQAAAFDHDKKALAKAAPKTSAEAAGISPEQAAHESGD